MRFLGTALLSVALLGSSAWAQDKIYLLDGSTLPAEGQSWTLSVTKEDYKEVTYRQSNVRAVQQKLDAARVLRITRTDVPKDWEVAVNARTEGNLVEAADAFVRASGRSNPFWIKQYGLFEAGETFFQLQDWDNAVKTYEDLLTKVPNTRFLPQSLLRMAESYFNAKDIVKAGSAIRRLRSEARAKGFDPRWDSLAEFWEIRCLESKGDWNNVISRFRTLRTKVANSAPRIANKCSLRIGYGLIQQGNFSEAKDFYTGIISTAKDDEIESLAGAYLGLGNCFHSESQNQDKEKVAEARRHFLRVIVAYYDDPETTGEVPPEIAAEALYKAGLCFEIMRDENYRRRSRELYAEVTRDFPSTRWAGEARKRR